VIAADVQYLLGAPSASAGYANAGSVYNSNGHFCSTTQIDLTVAQNNFFPDLTGPQNAAMQVDYQCAFVYNSNTTTTMVSAIAWIPASTVTSASIDWALGLDPTGATAFTSTSPQAVLISSPYVLPAGIASWVPPSSTSAGGVLMGNIGPRSVYPVWIRRSATGSPGNSQFNLQVTFQVSS
jgi:hypothetical protein